MYLGPLKWPSRSVWIAAGCLTLLVGVLQSLGVQVIPMLGGVVIIILLIAAPRRVRSLGGEKIPPSDPEER
jgi:repressor of nif and glnA expression